MTAFYIGRIKARFLRHGGRRPEMIGHRIKIIVADNGAVINRIILFEYRIVIGYKRLRIAVRLGIPSRMGQLTYKIRLKAVMPHTFLFSIVYKLFKCV